MHDNDAIYTIIMYTLMPEDAYGYDALEFNKQKHLKLIL